MTNKTSKESKNQKTAVIYTRVSTKEQARRGASDDREDDGYSLTAQRQACYRKADELGATVIEEFQDAGESARSANRKDLQRMLTFISEHRPDFVIVHKVDRLARNRADDVQINLAIETAGGQLVSVSESIDGTPSGTMLHGIMATIAEFYSRNLATETKKGTIQKVEQGGTPFRAPLGYLNVTVKVNGRETHTIETDSERVDLVRWLFEQYATGEWSFKRLAEAATARGLTTRPTPTRPAKPLDAKTVSWILKNPYYEGRVIYNGLEYQGNHQPIITDKLFQQVQDVIAEHSQAKEHPSKHHHYLAGSLHCARCGEALVYNVITGHGGRYDYFTCLGRINRHNNCDLPYLPAEKVEQAVDTLWQTERLPSEAINCLTTQLQAYIASQSQTIAHDIRLLDRRISQLNQQRIKWAEDTIDSAVPRDIAITKQQQISHQLNQLTTQRRTLNLVITKHREALARSIYMLRDMPDTYKEAEPPLRRSYNQACFDYIDIDDLEGLPVAVDSTYQPDVTAIRQTIKDLVSSSTDPSSNNQSMIEPSTQCDIMTRTNSLAELVRTCDLPTTTDLVSQPIMACQTTKKPTMTMDGTVQSVSVSDNRSLGWLTRLELATAWTTTRSSTN